MSWIIDSSYSWIQKLCVNIIKSGPVPKHVAFIMDGNRRFAQKNNVKKIEGHSKGFDKLAETLQWCQDLGITEVTVYAFSIENFKRSKEEVDTLMKLAKDKFEQLLYKEKDKVMKNGVCIRIIGDLSLLNNELRKLIAEVMLMTKDNTKAFLNIAFAYTAREEMTSAMKEILTGVEQGFLQEADIDENLISNCLYTRGSPDPELLVRTSGEVRFSDFLLWQISSAQVYFADVLWPEFNIWHLLAGLFSYQRGVSMTEAMKRTQDKLAPCRDEASKARVSAFLQQLGEQRLSQLRDYTKVYIPC